MFSLASPALSSFARRDGEEELDDIAQSRVGHALTAKTLVVMGAYSDAELALIVLNYNVSHIVVYGANGDCRRRDIVSVHSNLCKMSSQFLEHSFRCHNRDSLDQAERLRTATLSASDAIEADKQAPAYAASTFVCTVSSGFTRRAEPLAATSRGQAPVHQNARLSPDRL